MATQTDIARQYAEICEFLCVAGSNPGDAVVAARFGVEPWSKQFWEIVSFIVELADEICVLIDSLPLDEDIKNQARSHIQTSKIAFSKEGLVNHWSHACTQYLSPAQISPIKMLSGQIRAISAMPKFDEIEIQEILSEIDELIGWLKDHQLSDQDFIRQSLIEGLGKFRKKLANFGILGWGFTIESLREVISAYMILDRGFPADVDNPLAHGMLQKTGTFIKGVWEKAGTAKDTWETGDWVLRIVGGLHLVQAAPNGIAGLLGVS